MKRLPARHGLALNRLKFVLEHVIKVIFAVGGGDSRDTREHIGFAFLERVEDRVSSPNKDS